MALNILFYIFVQTGILGNEDYKFKILINFEKPMKIALYNTKT